MLQGRCNVNLLMFIYGMCRKLCSGVNKSGGDFGSGSFDTLENSSPDLNLGRFLVIMYKQINDDFEWQVDPFGFFFLVFFSIKYVSSCYYFCYFY